MQITGEEVISAPRQQVWDALNDPAMLRVAIPGCETLERDGDDRFNAVVVAKIGPVRARFNGKAMLSKIQAPERYTISGEGSGGVAGMAKGGADVELEDRGDETLLRYAVKADVGGKLAQVGSRLIESTAKKYAKDFFGRFNDAVTGKIDVGALQDAAAATPASIPAPAGTVLAAHRGEDDPNVAHLRHLNWALLALLGATVLIHAMLCG